MKKNIFVTFFVIGVLLYAQSLSSSVFQYDDRSTILLNPFIRELNLFLIWQNFNTRFIGGLSFALNYFFSGLSVFPYHLFNLILHIFNAYLVSRFAAATLALPYFREKVFSRYGQEIAFFAGLVFLCHPLATEPVNFITQRFVLFTTLFYLSALLFYIEARVKKSTPAYILCLASIICAMFSKEIAVTLPLMIVAYEIFFLRDYLIERKQLVLMLAPIIATLLIIPLFLTMTSTMTAPTARIAALTNNENPLGYQNTARNSVDITRAGGKTLTRSEYFFTELNVLTTYLRLFVFPVNQNVVYDYPVAKDFKNTKTIASALLLLALMVAGFAAFEKQRLFSFVIFWFFLTLSVESSFIPIAHVIAEYRMYLALFGCAVIVPAVIFYFLRNQRRLAIVVLSTISVIFCVLTWQRNGVWLTEKSFWEDIVRKSPRYARAHTGLGIVYLNENDNKRAIDHSLTAIELDPQNLMAFMTIGYAKFNLAQYEESLKIFESVVSVDPGNAVAFHGLGKCLAKLGRFADALESFKKAAQLDPTMKEAYPALIMCAVKTNRGSEVAEIIQNLNRLGYHEIAQYVRSIYER